MPGKCPKVPHRLCAVAYDEPDCDKEDWTIPLDIPETNELDLGFFSDFRESIESVSVRAGCTLDMHDEGDLSKSSNWATVTAPATTDLHLNLAKSKDKNIRDLEDDIESLKCTCP